MNLTDLTVKDFLNKVISNEPVPGGGSISALNAAIAASLTGMVANLTIGRKKYASVEDEMAEVVAQVTELQKRFIEDVDRDSEAYSKVMAAFKLPKETEEEIAIRKTEIQEATKHAAVVPLVVARDARRMMGLISEVAYKGNQNAFTDACVAMMCCRTAVVGAILNVRINLQSIEDENFVQELETEIQQLEQEAWEKENRLLLHARDEYKL